jgi:hypothetical protein
LRAIFAGHAEVDEIVWEIDALRCERLRLEATVARRPRRFSTLLTDLAGLLHRSRCAHEPAAWTYPPACRHCGHTLPEPTA